MFGFKSKLGRLFSRLPARKKKKDELLTACFDDFVQDGSRKLRFHRAVIPEMDLVISEDEYSKTYTFYSPKLKCLAINVSFKDDYLTVERSIKKQEAKFFKGAYEKNSISRVSARSYYVSGIVEDSITHELHGNKLIVKFKKAAR